MHESWHTGWPQPSEFYGHIPVKRQFLANRNFRYFAAFSLSALFVVFIWAGVYFSILSPLPPKASALPATVVLIQEPAVTQTSSDSSLRLQNLLESWANAHPSQDWGINVREVDGKGTNASYNSDKPFYPASLYKLLALRSLFEKLSYPSWDNAMRGNSSSYGVCIDKMMRLSDNPCGIAIGKFIGWKNIERGLKKQGLKNTVLTGPDNQLRTTAADISLYLQNFYADNSYPQAKQAVMTSMSKQIFNKGIKAGSPGCSVYDKIGDLNGVRHDAAIVECPGTSYILTVMSQGGSYVQIADLARQVNAVLLGSGN